MIQKTMRRCVAVSVLSFACVQPALADDTGGDHPIHADTHAPIGVMGDHTHNKGEWMLSYRFMRMEMNGNQINHHDVGPDFIATNVPNIFNPGVPMQPPTLRIVPEKMTMDMNMFGVMHAITDRWTLLGMLNFVEKEMTLVTYQGPSGTNVLGKFKTKSSGLGDTLIGGMFRLVNTPNEKWHLNATVSLPTGDLKETDQALTPMNMMPTVRLPYGMQLGSGTVDLKPGITYNGRAGQFTWGAQYIGTFRIGENDEGYTLGDMQQLTGWAVWSPVPPISMSGRLAYESVDRIRGMDPDIVGPIQTANPDLYGGNSLYGYVGANVAGQSGWMRGHRLAVEFGVPLAQDLNGPQMKQDWSLTAGWQYSF